MTNTAIGYKSTFHEDSDADDEYERSVIPSPALPPDIDYSPSDSEPPSTEHTPTTFTHSGPNHDSPTGIISQWTAEQSAGFIVGIGLKQYKENFIDEGIDGFALIALQHSELKEMGITSVGHRLTVLKSVYDVKVKQNIRLEPDHYIPPSADAESHETPPTHDDISRIIRILKDRDERIHTAETELRILKEDLDRVLDENRKLREEILPLVRMAKDRSQPLPTPDDHGNGLPERTQSSLSRKFSKKKLFLGSAPKNPSPTIHEGRTLTDTSSLDPSAAAMAASSTLIGGEHGARSPHSVAQPSPTSPPYSIQSSATAARSFRSHAADDSHWNSTTLTTSERDSRQPTSAPMQQRGPPSATVQTPESADAPLSGTSVNTNLSTSSQQVTTPASATSTNPQVEIFKSFRVSIDDPCHKVLPVALKKYNITADWRQYALYIVHGDQERCLGLNERPLILFKQLDREGRKPMFMLRKHAAPAEGHVSTIGGGTPQGQWPGEGQHRWAGGGDQLPGGVL